MAISGLLWMNDETATTINGVSVGAGDLNNAGTSAQQLNLTGCEIQSSTVLYKPSHGYEFDSSNNALKLYDQDDDDDSVNLGIYEITASTQDTITTSGVVSLGDTGSIVDVNVGGPLLAGQPYFYYGSGSISQQLGLYEPCMLHGLNVKWSGTGELADLNLGFYRTFGGIPSFFATYSLVGCGANNHAFWRLDKEEISEPSPWSFGPYPNGQIPSALVQWTDGGTNSWEMAAWLYPTRLLRD